MFQTLVNAWKIPDLRKKILFTAFIIVIYRVGANIPVPFVDIIEGGLLGGTEGTTFLNYLSMMTGDAFNYGTIFALSITPYINSSIIIQLLTVAIPALERLSKEGEEGRKKIATITRYMTLGLGLLQSIALQKYSKQSLLSQFLQQVQHLLCGSANRLTIRVLVTVSQLSFLQVSFPVSPQKQQCSSVHLMQHPVTSHEAVFTTSLLPS